MNSEGFMGFGIWGVGDGESVSDAMGAQIYIQVPKVGH